MTTYYYHNLLLLLLLLFTSLCVFTELLHFVL